MKIPGMFLLLPAAALVACSPGSAPDSSVRARLAQWERGLLVESPHDPAMKMYLWFYEWHMFDAVEPGQHTVGTWANRSTVRDRGSRATIASSNPGIEIDMTAVEDGAEMKLTVTNHSEHDWPELAALIACFNPGPEGERNRQFANTKSWIHTDGGLSPLAMEDLREIHFNHDLRAGVDARADEAGRYAWSSKWPKSNVDAVDGLIIRESTEGDWVTAIAWDRFLSAQGHNPWECMHLSVQVGPLERGETRTVDGKIYLFEGTKEEALARYRKEF